MVANRFDIYLANLNPTVGSEMQKTRPCLIISPDEMNRHIQTVIVVKITKRAFLENSGNTTDSDDCC